MRSIVLVVGAVCVIFKLIDNKANQPKEQRESFQTVEFDDIW